MIQALQSQEGNNPKKVKFKQKTCKACKAKFTPNRNFMACCGYDCLNRNGWLELGMDKFSFGAELGVLFTAVRK